jgi:hypothetical protein
MVSEPNSSSAGESLEYIMRRRGWNPPRLSELTAGAVSPSSIRVYAADKSRPRSGLALAIANAIGPEHGAALLRLWDYPDLADGFLDEWKEEALSTNDKLHHWAEVSYRLNRIEYDGDPLSNEAIAIVGQVITGLQRMNGRPRPQD